MLIFQRERERERELSLERERVERERGGAIITYIYISCLILNNNILYHVCYNIYLIIMLPLLKKKTRIFLLFFDKIYYTVLNSTFIISIQLSMDDNIA